MKTANVRQLRRDFGRVMSWVADGEQVQIVKKGKIIALLSPPPPAKPEKIKLPDFAAQWKRIFGGRVANQKPHNCEAGNHLINSIG
jgi:antitoxin (DNA-binding transcriptional repressor) of toxin-antitoxin stability system